MLTQDDEYPVETKFFYIDPTFKIASFTHPISNGDPTGFIENAKKGGIHFYLFLTEKEADEAAMAWVRSEIDRLKIILAGFKSF